MISLVETLLAALLVIAAAWSVEEARWILGDPALTGFLAPVGVAGVAVGALGGAFRRGRRVVYPVGAVIGALVVPVVVGSIIVPGASPTDAFRATGTATLEAYLDLAWRGMLLTPQVGHYMLTLGLAIWGTGLFAGYAVVGRGRPIDAIVAAGIVLLTNMSLTTLDQLELLVLFSVAALLLLVRMHADDEVSTWIRRRMGETDGVTSLYLRGGVAFAAAAVAGSLLLTSVATSAPLASAWIDAGQRLTEAGEALDLERFLPRGGAGSRFSGLAFGTTATITGQWTTDATEALRIELDDPSRTPRYWRAVAYDRYELGGWSVTPDGETTYEAGEQLATASADAYVEPDAMTTLRYTVEPARYRGRQVFLAGIPATVSAGTRATLVGGGYLATLERDGDAAASYEVEVLIRPSGDATGGVTERRLRAAGSDYPAGIAEAYLGLPDGALGENATALLEAIRARSPGETPYDLAKTAAQYLRSELFTYDTNVVDRPCASRSVAECFATTRAGYCQHYATTMTVLLRAAGVPARFVEGFLPGRRDPYGVETIPSSNAHAWVEVFFPGYGWVPFDPTGGGVARLPAIPAGSADETPAPDATGGSDASPTPRPTGRDTEPEESTAGSGTVRGVDPRGPLVLVALVLALLVGGAAVAAYRRVPSGGSAPELVFARVSTIAARLGFARRPSETIYEYAGSLGEALPAARPELQAVAQATVESVYGRRQLDGERLARLAAAEERLRVALLRLLLRRGR